jgi:hypothetical protein
MNQSPEADKNRNDLTAKAVNEREIGKKRSTLRLRVAGAPAYRRRCSRW